MPPDRPPGMFAPATLVTGLLLSLAFGAGAWFATSEAIESDAHARFRSMARASQYAIDARIKGYSDVLRGAAGLFRAAPHTTADQFRQYVQQLDTKRNFPGIEVINYARTIHTPGLPALNEELRGRLARRGVHHYEPLVAHPDRNTYTVLVYIEPLLPLSLTKLGMDLEARGTTRRALASARDSGLPSASGTRIELFSGPNQNGLALRLPVYRSDMPTDSVEGRRLAYIGSVGIGFGVARLVGGVLDEFPIRGARLILTELTAVTPEPGETLPRATLYDSLASPERPNPPPPLDDSSVFATSLPIEFNQRIWRADFSIPKSVLYTRFDMYYPWLAAFAAGISTALLYALFQILASSRRNALRMAEEMTRELRASQAKLQASHEKLRLLAAHAEQIKEGERKRIAREIHDDLAQNLLALKIEAELLANRTRGGHRRLHARADATVRQIDVTIRSVRQIINDLRPNVLDLGLSAAVDWQVADFARRTGIECELVDDDGEHRIDDHSATAFFRILQESLNNVARHARATRVRIALQQQADMLTMTIRDNGVGMQPGSRNRHGSFGLVGIEERVGILGGSFSISSGLDVGTTVVVSIPVTPMFGDDDVMYGGPLSTVAVAA
ncbi:CHASE domain-containing protein [Massilia sp. CFBP9012]|uniref:sensor histidine kinase n=1 Tax=Massilia sp. CFBP9012 TaxID=3096531 RepID=UPI002A6B276F|nr:CHASE domain-containing protein [Massilia sp. CFBP9012]MDY0974897.1 CHASE domain-containing protein [Massilia sp. CFBP9012]